MRPVKSGGRGSARRSHDFFHPPFLSASMDDRNGGLVGHVEEDEGIDGKSVEDGYASGQSGTCYLRALLRGGAFRVVAVWRCVRGAANGHRRLRLITTAAAPGAAMTDTDERRAAVAWTIYVPPSLRICDYRVAGHSARTDDRLRWSNEAIAVRSRLHYVAHRAHLSIALTSPPLLSLAAAPPPLCFFFAGTATR